MLYEWQLRKYTFASLWYCESVGKRKSYYDIRLTRISSFSCVRTPAIAHTQLLVTIQYSCTRLFIISTRLTEAASIFMHQKDKHNRIWREDGGSLASWTCYIKPIFCRSNSKDQQKQKLACLLHTKTIWPDWWRIEEAGSTRPDGSGKLIRCRRRRWQCESRRVCQRRGGRGAAWGCRRCRSKPSCSLRQRNHRRSSRYTSWIMTLVASHAGHHCGQAARIAVGRFTGWFDPDRMGRGGRGGG